MRQWVLSVPKHLRYFLQRDGAALNTALRIFLRVVQHSLVEHCPGAARSGKAVQRIGAVAFIHRFGSSLNTHVHFHCCVVDGVFEPMPGGNGDEANSVAQTTGQTTDAPPGVAFHRASGLDDAGVAQVRADARKRILRAFVRRGLIEADDAKEMARFQHGGGFSVDAGVCIAATDRAGLERLLRYCARPPFARDRLRQRGADLVYHCPQPQCGGKQADLVLTPLE